jgi:hypothetical protein
MVHGSLVRGFGTVCPCCLATGKERERQSGFLRRRASLSHSVIASCVLLSSVSASASRQADTNPAIPVCCEPSTCLTNRILRCRRRHRKRPDAKVRFPDFMRVGSRRGAQSSALLSVRDTGPGISSADQARLFQEFQQADNAITKKKGGTGLGLAISKRIIEMHGGRIWVESQVGRGSTFTFTLPMIVERQIEAA